MITGVSRRALLGGVATLPFFPLALGACARPPETPLAHLYGKEWVHGAYELYAGKYLGVQSGASQQTDDVYRVLAQKGVTALDALQTREVPFFIRVDPAASAFSIERDVPERLKFTANMSDSDRAAATANWNTARDHIQTDYEEIRRLDWALTRLLQQTQRIRSAIDEGRVEQYRLVSQLGELAKGEAVPFPLPYQVSAKDYSEIVLLLLERLEDDRHRLEAIEASIVAVGLTVRATDAGSGTLSASIHKVLLAVIHDADAEAPRAAAFPSAEADRAKLLSDGKALFASIQKSPEYVAWDKSERVKKWEQVGSFLTLLDAMTGLPTSSVYRQVLQVWSGQGDYFSYLKTLASMTPVGKEVAKTIVQAIETTEKVRAIAAKVQTVAAGGIPSTDALLAQGKGALINTGTQFARDRASRQLSFFREKGELDAMSQLMAQSKLMDGVLPAL